MKTKFKFVSRFFAPGALLPWLVLFSVWTTPHTATAGSLWREAVTDERGMYADKKARRIGDIVTVEIDETIVFSNVKRMDSSRVPTSEPGLAGQFMNSLINSVSSKQASTAAGDPIRRKFPLNLLPRPSEDTPRILNPGSLSSGLESLGRVENTQRFRFMMAVQVVDTLPNGNLVIEGVKQVGFSKERQFISLRGIIRPTDILFGMRAATNVAPSILSRHIADARIEVVSEGALSDTAKKGWLQQLDDKITPY
jgi:flagellar L-ring protein precursor FlgH